MDQLSFWLGISQVIVGTLAVAVVFVGYLEYVKVRALRAELEALRTELNERFYRSAKAQQRIVASYSISDPNQRLLLLQSAADAYPEAFNVFNAIGYAHLEVGDTHAAIAAFQEATVRHPKAKEGWFDLAGAYLRLDPPRRDLARQSVKKALKADPTARADAMNDERFRYFVQDS